MTENIAAALEPLGIEWKRNDGEVIIDAIVIARVSNADDSTTVLYECSPGSDLVVRNGLLAAAVQLENSIGWSKMEDDD